MALSDEARKVWKSKGGASLLGAMLGQEPLTPEAQQTLNKLKAINVLERARAKVAVDGEALQPNADAAAGRDDAAGGQPGAED